MGAAVTFRNDLLRLILNGTAIDNIAINNTTSPDTSFWMSLHTADPSSESSGQSTSETTYPAYARMELRRNASDTSPPGFTVTGNSAVPNANIDFPAATTMGSTQTITHLVIGRLSSGTGKQYLVGTISPSIVVNTGVIPRLTTATTITLT